jgi:hypothetical protein
VKGGSGIMDQDLKEQLCPGSERTSSRIFRKVLMLEIVKRRVEMSVSQPRRFAGKNGESDRFSSLQNGGCGGQKTDRAEIRAGQEQMASLIFWIEANQAKTNINLNEEKKSNLDKLL